MNDYSHQPGRFRNKITNEEFDAIQWRGWNHYPVTKFLDDALYTFDKHGNMCVYTEDFVLWLKPMDWVIITETDINCCAPMIFEQLAEEL